MDGPISVTRCSSMILLFQNNSAVLCGGYRAVPVRWWYFAPDLSKSLRRTMVSQSPPPLSLRLLGLRQIAVLPVASTGHWQNGPHHFSAAESHS